MCRIFDSARQGGRALAGLCEECGGIEALQRRVKWISSFTDRRLDIEWKRKVLKKKLYYYDFSHVPVHSFGYR